MSFHKEGANTVYLCSPAKFWEGMAKFLYDEHMDAHERGGGIGAGGTGEAILTGEIIDAGTIALCDGPEGFAGDGVIQQSLSDRQDAAIGDGDVADGGEGQFFPQAQGDTKFCIHGQALAIHASAGGDDLDMAIGADGMFRRGSHIGGIAEGEFDFTGIQFSIGGEDERIAACSADDTAAAFGGECDAIG